MTPKNTQNLIELLKKIKEFINFDFLTDRFLIFVFNNQNKTFVKHILINGGLGFVGFHTAKALETNPNYKTIIFDASKEYIKYGVKFNPYKRREELLNSSTIIHGNCNDKLHFQAVWEEYKPNILIHFASLPIVWKADLEPITAQEDIENSIKSALDVIGKSKHFPEKIIYISSSMVYGHFLRNKNNILLPANENQPTNPLDVYGRLKLNSEKNIEKFSIENNIDYSIIRPSAVYGPEDYNKRVVELFLMNALKGQEIVISGDGELTLDFTYVDDLVEGIIKAMEIKTQSKIFNITYGKGYTINELSECIKNYYPQITIKKGLIHPNRPNRTYLDTSRAKLELNYSPKIPLEEGIKRYINYLLENNIYA